MTKLTSKKHNAISLSVCPLASLSVTVTHCPLAAWVANYKAAVWCGLLVGNWLRWLDPAILALQAARSISALASDTPAANCVHEEALHQVLLCDQRTNCRSGRASCCMQHANFRQMALVSPGVSVPISMVCNLHGVQTTGAQRPCIRVQACQFGAVLCPPAAGASDDAKRFQRFTACSAASVCRATIND